MMTKRVTFATLEKLLVSLSFKQVQTTELDTGEAEAIALAMELNAKRLLMDERIGRAVGESE